MKIGTFLILTSFEIDEERIIELHPGGSTKTDAKRALKDIRERMDCYRQHNLQSYVVRLVGSYSNYMQRTRDFENMAGVARPDTVEMKVQ